MIVAGPFAEIAEDPYREVAARAVRAATPRPGTVERPGLVDRLVHAGPDAIVLLAAPAGYGKTTTLALWDAADPRPFAWVHLDPTDEDPVHFFRHLGAALDSVHPLSSEERAGWSGPGRLVERHLVPATEAALAARAPCVVVLDDVHLLRSPGAADSLEHLSRAIPPGCVLALAGRSLPGRLTTRARMSGRACEVDATDLALSGDEATELLRRGGLTLDQSSIDTLVRRTEGWAGGLHLASLALAGRSDGVEAFTGRNRLVADYLVEELLLGLDPALVDLLEHSALLDRMNGPLLDEVLERSDSARVLHDLERSGNLLLVPLDDERDWYRYHHLFAEILRQRAERRDPDRCRQIRRRACAEFSEHGDLDAAIGLAVAAGDGDHAADLAITDLLETVQESRFERLLRRVDLLPPGIAETSASGAVALAWCGLGTGDVPRLLRGLAAAEKHDPDAPLADGSPSLATNLAVIRMMLGADGLNGIIDDATAARAAGPPPANPWWVAATVGEAGALAALGEDERARRQLEDALPHTRTQPTSAAVALAQLALLAHRSGDARTAREHVAESMGVADRHHLDATLICTAAYGIAAMVAASSGQDGEFLRRCRIAQELLARLGPMSARTAMLTNLCLAEGEFARGDRDEARRYLRAAEIANERDPSATQQVADLAVLTEQLRGPSPSDLGITGAEARVLARLDSHLSLGEIAEQLYVSRNTVKSHAVAIYRKLGVSSRSDAVRAARRLGLLARPVVAAN